MSPAKACFLLALTVLALFASSTHAQIFPRRGGGRNSNSIKPFCLLGRRLAQNRLDCSNNNGALCMYIMANIGRCGEGAGSARKAVGNMMASLNLDGLRRTSRIPIPRFGMNRDH